MQWQPVRHLFMVGSVAALTFALAGTALATPVSGPGKVSVGVEVSVWDSSLAVGPGIVPIGGAGQVNGEFTTAERLGVEIGLRAQKRFGPLPLLTATPNKNGKVGIYDATTGVSDGAGRATWNYDWHVDLRGARGVAKGTTLADYDLTLETDISSTDTLYGVFPIPLDLAQFVLGNTVLYQGSENPKFGNPTFDSNDPDTYHFRLVLTPKTFNGPPLAVAIRVDVS